MISVRLRENPAFTWQAATFQPRYFCDVELAGIEPGRGAIPVYWRSGSSPARPELYVADVAGWRLECANIFALRRDVLRTLEQLWCYRGLPEYVIVVGNGREVAPVYRVKGRLQVRLHGSPIFLAPDIGSLALSLRRYLAAAGPAPDVVAARVCHTDLQLYEPCAVLEANGHVPVWIPVYVEAGMLLAEHQGRRFPAEPLPYTMPGLLCLRRELAGHLVRQRRIGEPGELKLRLMAGRALEELYASLPPSEYVLHIPTNGARRPVTVHRIGTEFIVCHAPDSTIEVGETVGELRRRLGASQARTGSTMPAAVQSASSH
jgi:hypothetical protein